MKFRENEQNLLENRNFECGNKLYTLPKKIIGETWKSRIDNIFS